MDLISKRRAKNIQTRFSSAVLLAGYCLLAVFTSLPSKATKTVDPATSIVATKTIATAGTIVVTGTIVAAASQITTSSHTAPLAPSPLPLIISTAAPLQTAKPETANKTAKPIAPLIDKAVVSASPVAMKKELKKTVREAAPAALKTLPKTSPPPKPVQLLVLLRVPEKPIVKTEKIAAPPFPEDKPDTLTTPEAKRSAITARATPALATTSLASLSLPADLPAPDAPLRLNVQPGQNALPGQNTPPSKIRESDFEALAPKALFAYFKKLQRPAPVATPAARCIADNIAGWSGTKLLPRHKKILKQSNTPASEISKTLAARLAKNGFTPGSPVFMRLFKDKSELEVWLKKGERYALYHTFKICRWSGSFGPKLYEGDKQSPEGFYTVNRQLFMRPSWRWKGSFSIGYPNAYDKLHGRTGSLILVHGGCTSSGCFAMTDPVIKEVRELAQLARDNGQTRFNIHIYPFRLTTANLEKRKGSAWMPFWNNLKEGYDLFEKTGSPARVRVCDRRYVFARDGVERSDEGWSGEGCYGLADHVPDWQAANRYAQKSNTTQSRRTARRAKRRTSCNLKRASCRKFVALKRKKSATRSRKAIRSKRLARKKHLNRKKRLASKRRANIRRAKKRAANKRRATIRRAKAIGRKKAYKPFAGAGNR